MAQEQKRKRSTVTDKDFDYAKLLLEKFSAPQVANLTGFSRATIGRMSRNKTYADYLIYMRTVVAPRREPKAVAPTAPAIDLDALFDGEPKLNGFSPATIEDVNNEPLTRIAVALERLADAWESKPKGRRIF